MTRSRSTTPGSRTESYWLISISVILMTRVSMLATDDIGSNTTQLRRHLVQTMHQPPWLISYVLSQNLHFMQRVNASSPFGNGLTLRIRTHIFMDPSTLLTSMGVKPVIESHSLIGRHYIIVKICSAIKYLPWNCPSTQSISVDFIQLSMIKQRLHIRLKLTPRKASFQKE